MKCENCLRFEKCDIVSQLIDVIEKIRKVKKQKKLIVGLSSDPKQAIEEARNKYKELRSEYDELKSQQIRCQRRRLILYYKGYDVFKKKKHSSKKSNDSTQVEVLKTLNET